MVRSYHAKPRRRRESGPAVPQTDAPGNGIRRVFIRAVESVHKTTYSVSSF